MSPSSLLRANLFIGVALLAGCGGSQSPIGPPGVMPQGPAIAAHAERIGSWMLPEATSQDLLYISEIRRVGVYTYPQGKFLYTLKHFYIAQGMCADKTGDVFVVDLGYRKIFEYAHGGKKRIATLQNPTEDPVGCSIDPTTGNLAVASQGSGSGGVVSIFKDAHGKPTTYTDTAFEQFYFCGYDSNGNLFVDGLVGPGSGDFGLAELVNGASQLTTIKISQYVTWPGGVQWDGTNLAVGDQAKPVVYRFAISGGEGSVQGVTDMKSGANNVKQFWIQGQSLIAPNTIPGRGGYGSKALFYNYPVGGKATKKISKDVLAAQGAVVSLAPSR